MADGFAVNTEQLRHSGGRFDALGRERSAQASTLRGQLAGDVGVWGADEPGSAFGSSYAEIAEAAGRALSSIGAGLSGRGGTLREVAADIETVDDQQAMELQRIADELGSAR